MGTGHRIREYYVVVYRTSLTIHSTIYKLYQKPRGETTMTHVLSPW
jgi:hypothetical protein